MIPRKEKAETTIQKGGKAVETVWKHIKENLYAKGSQWGM